MKRIALAHVADLRRRIRETEKMATPLEELAAFCAGDNRPECPILAKLEDPDSSGDHPPLPRRRKPAGAS